MFSTTHSKSTTLKQVIEVYLFINPMGSICYQAEKEVVNFLENSDEKIHVTFIPVLNFKTLSNYMSAMDLPKNNLALRNELFSTTYDTCLSYAAATMQGKKKGRKFLISLQHAMIEERLPYSESLVLEIAEKVKLDTQMFLEDKKSDFAKAAFEADQKIAREMNASETPSCVLFSDQYKDHGLLIEDCITVDLLQTLCDLNPSINEVRNRLISDKTIRSVRTTSLHVL